MSKICNGCYTFASVKPRFPAIQNPSHLSSRSLHAPESDPILECLVLSVTWALVPLCVQMTQLQGAAVPEHPVA